MISLETMEKLTHNREMIDTAKLLCINDPKLGYSLDVEHPDKQRIERETLKASMTYFADNVLHRILKVKQIPCTIKRKHRSIRVLKLKIDKPTDPRIKKGCILYECVLR